MGSVLAITARSRAQLVAERRCLVGLVPWRGTSLRRAFRAGLPRGWHAVLPIILPAGEFPCWCRWRACLISCCPARWWACSLARPGLCWPLDVVSRGQGALQVEGAMTIYRSLLRSREGWRLRHGPAAAEVAFSLTHSLSFHFIALHCIALHCIALHYITLHSIAFHCITLHCITLHYIALHCIALHRITLHYITFHYITLHHITCIHVCV